MYYYLMRDFKNDTAKPTTLTGAQRKNLCCLNARLSWISSQNALVAKVEVRRVAKLSYVPESLIVSKRKARLAGEHRFSFCMQAH